MAAANLSSIISQISNSGRYLYSKDMTSSDVYETFRQLEPAERVTQWHMILDSIVPEPLTDMIANYFKKIIRNKIRDGISPEETYPYQQINLSQFVDYITARSFGLSQLEYVRCMQHAEGAALKFNEQFNASENILPPEKTYEFFTALADRLPGRLHRSTQDHLIHSMIYLSAALPKERIKEAFHVTLKKIGPAFATHENMLLSYCTRFLATLAPGNQKLELLEATLGKVQEVKLYDRALQRLVWKPLAFTGMPKEHGLAALSRVLNAMPEGDNWKTRRKLAYIAAALCGVEDYPGEKPGCGYIPLNNRYTSLKWIDAAMSWFPDEQRLEYAQKQLEGC